MKELTNLEIAMLSPVKRQIYLKRRRRARIKGYIERIEVVPFHHPINGYTFWMPLDKARVMAELFSELEEFYKTRNLDIEDMFTECEEES